MSGKKGAAERKGYAGYAARASGCVAAFPLNRPICHLQSDLWTSAAHSTAPAPLKPFEQVMCGRDTALKITTTKHKKAKSSSSVDGIFVVFGFSLLWCLSLFLLSLSLSLVYIYIIYIVYMQYLPYTFCLISFANCLLFVLPLFQLSSGLLAMQKAQPEPRSPGAQEPAEKHAFPCEIHFLQAKEFINQKFMLLGMRFRERGKCVA